MSFAILGPHVEYAGGSIQYGTLFVFSLLYEYSNLEYEHIPVYYRVHSVEYGIHIRVAASQEYVKTYSTRRMMGPKDADMQLIITRTPRPCSVCGSPHLCRRRERCLIEARFGRWPLAWRKI